MHAKQIETIESLKQKVRELEENGHRKEQALTQQTQFINNLMNKISEMNERIVSLEGKTIPDPEEKAKKRGFVRVR
jgi:flagellar hook-associated protein FlgK